MARSSALRQTGAGIGIYQSPGANVLEVEQAVKAPMVVLAARDSRRDSCSLVPF